MSEKPISVTEAARNFADCINRVRYQGVTFTLHKSGVPVARIVPESGKVCTGKALAEALARVRLSADESAAWLGDLESARGKLTPQSNKW